MNCLMSGRKMILVSNWANMTTTVPLIAGEPFGLTLWNPFFISLFIVGRGYRGHMKTIYVHAQGLCMLDRTWK